MNQTFDFAWNFSCEDFSDKDLSAFLAAFTDYNVKIMKMTPPLVDFELIPESELVLHFSGVGPDDEYDDMEAVIRSGGGPLTFHRFMYESHKAMYPFLKDADHVFFEGVAIEPAHSGELRQAHLHMGS